MLPAQILQLCLSPMGAPAAWSLQLASKAARSMVFEALSRQDQQAMQRMLLETVRSVAFSLDALPQLISDLEEEAGREATSEEQGFWEAWYLPKDDKQAEQQQQAVARLALTWLLRTGRQLWGDLEALRHMDVPGALYAARYNASVTNCILQLLPPVPVGFVIECAKRGVRALDLANRTQVLLPAMVAGDAAADDNDKDGEGLLPTAHQLLLVMLQPPEQLAEVVAALLQQVSAGAAWLSPNDLHELCSVAVTMPPSAAEALVEQYTAQAKALAWSPTQLQQLLLVALRLRCSEKVLLPLLELPQARRLPWPGVHQLVRAAARHGGTAYVLRMLPDPEQQGPWPARELLAVAAAAIGTDPELEQAVLTAPAAAEWGADEVLQLVRWAAVVQACPAALLDLVEQRLPTAGLPLQQLRPIIHAACRASNVQMLRGLLALPATQAAPFEVAAGFVVSALKAECREAVCMLMALPALRQAPLAAALQLMRNGIWAVREEFGDALSTMPVAALMQLPGAQLAVEPAADQEALRQLLLLLLETMALEVPWGGQLLWLPCAQALAPPDVGGLLLSALTGQPFLHDYGVPPEPNLNGYLVSLARLPGARGISPLLLGPLLEKALELRYSYNILHTPPHTVLQCCCDMMASGYCAAGALLQLPAARQLPARLLEGVLLIGEHMLRPKPPCCTRYLRQQLGVPPDQPPVVPGVPLQQ